MPLRFDPHDPFPLFENYERDVTPSEAVEHSAQADRWLGLRTEETEKKIRAGRKSPEHANWWIGLPVDSLLTPYVELRFILSRLDPRAGETVVDLGAGYGRMGFVIARHHPQVNFLGLEVVPERVQEGLRVLPQENRIRLLEQDLSAPEFRLPEAKHYFLYDFGSREAVERTLEQLREAARKQAIQVVGRGRRSRDLIERAHPWLSQVTPPEHHSHFTIYRNLTS